MRLSSLSLALAPLKEPVSDALQAKTGHFSHLVSWATIAVAVGVVFEAVEIIHDIVVWKKGRSRDKRDQSELEELSEFFPRTDVRGERESHPEPKSVKRALRFGLLLVVMGVVGEWRYGAKLEDAHNAIHEYDLGKIAAADKEAGEAAVSAKNAHDEADAVGKETTAIERRLDKALATLTMVEEDTLGQGPRWRLLERGESTFIEALKPFKGQRVTVVTCGYDDTERFALEEMLVSSSFPKAGWDKPDWRRWIGCPNMLSGGNEMYFVSATDDSSEWAGMPAQQWAKVQGGRFNTSHDALNTLWEVLYKLRIATTAWREKPLPQEEGVQTARSFFGLNAPDGPAELAYKDPGRIFLLIGPNEPLFTNRNKHQHRNVTHK